MAKSKPHCSQETSRALKPSGPPLTMILPSAIALIAVCYAVWFSSPTTAVLAVNTRREARAPTALPRCLRCDGVECKWAECTTMEVEARKKARQWLEELSAKPGRGLASLVEALCCAEGEPFLRHFWGQAPVVLNTPATKGALTYEDVEQVVMETDLEWSVARARGINHFTAVPHTNFGREGLKSSVASGTAIFNSFSLQHEKVARLSSLFTTSMGLPAIANVYVTGPRLRVSARPHNDLQDVVIIQTQGSKRWKIWPGYEMGQSKVSDEVTTEPKEFYRPHIFQMRGKKEGQELDIEELGPPLLDVELVAGQVLYVPRGFIHTTSTQGLTQHVGETSVHLTMNLETALMRQTYDGLLLCTYSLLSDALPEVNENVFLKMWQMVAVDDHTALREELPLGFVSRRWLNRSDDSWGNSSVVVDVMVAQMRHLVAQIGPPLGLLPEHFQHNPLQPHIKGIDALFRDVVQRFVYAHEDHLAGYTLKWSEWENRTPKERLDHFKKTVLKRPWKELLKECGHNVQPGGKFHEYAGGSGDDSE